MAAITKNRNFLKWQEKLILSRKLLKFNIRLVGLLTGQTTLIQVSMNRKIYSNNKK
jgi:hypothetical protein